MRAQERAETIRDERAREIVRDDCRKERVKLAKTRIL